MSQANAKQKLLQRRKFRVRKKVSGTPGRPRLSVRRSTNHIYAQVIDDLSGRTLISASSLGLKVKGSNVEGAEAVGKALAEKAKEQSISRVAFDRSGRRYHGRVQALAEAARKGGIEF